MICCTDELWAFGHLSSESPVKTSNRQNPQPTVAKRYLWRQDKEAVNKKGKGRKEREKKEKKGLKSPLPGQSCAAQSKETHEIPDLDTTAAHLTSSAALTCASSKVQSLHRETPTQRGHLSRKRNKWHVKGPLTHLYIWQEVKRNLKLDRGTALPLDVLVHLGRKAACVLTLISGCIPLVNDNKKRRFQDWKEGGERAGAVAYRALSQRQSPAGYSEWSSYSEGAPHPSVQFFHATSRRMSKRKSYCRCPQSRTSCFRWTPSTFCFSPHKRIDHQNIPETLDQNPSHYLDTSTVCPGNMKTLSRVHIPHLSA